MSELDQATLRKLLHYDPETGIFTWLLRKPEDVSSGRNCSWNRRYAGTQAGRICTSPKGKPYIHIGIFDRPRLAHRLAWLWMMGEWPDQLDHIDGNTLNNSWANLRLASNSQNQWNKGLDPRNKTGFKGVFRRGKKFCARIQAHGKNAYLGTFDTAEMAHQAYIKAAEKLHGEFARY